MIVSLILRSISIYEGIDRKVRLICLFFLSPVPFSMVRLLTFFTNAINLEHLKTLFILFMLVPIFFFIMLAVAVLVLFLYEWRGWVARRLKNVLLFNASVSLGMWWSYFSVIHLSQTIAEYVVLIFGRLF